MITEYGIEAKSNSEIISELAKLILKFIRKRSGDSYIKSKRVGETY